ncbi:MAG: sigma-70 family RNA polymerase sigma factor [Chloroflexota bacterium]
MTIPRNLKAALKRTLSSESKPIQQAVSKIVLKNESGGRLENHLKEHPNKTADDYIVLVLNYYKKVSPQLSRLVHEKADSDWLELMEKMNKWAYSLLRKRNPNFSHENLSNLSRDAVYSACGDVLKLYFPFDTPFDSWLYLVVKNNALAEMRKSFKRDEFANHGELDMSEDSNTLLTDSSFTNPEKIFSENERMEELRSCIEQLPDKQRNIIQAKFLEDLSTPEICERLEIKPNASHQLLFQARNNLIKCLNK